MISSIYCFSHFYSINSFHNIHSPINKHLTSFIIPTIIKNVSLNTFGSKFAHC